MKFIDLDAQYQRIKPQIKKRIETVLDHGMYINGPEVAQCEDKLAEFVGSKYCILVSSGTDAQLLPLLAMNLGSDDEVIIPAFSFFATSEVISLIKAKPVFCDVDPNTYCLDHTKLKSLMGPKTKAIMPVGLYGQCAEMDEINSHGIPVIEDAAQSFGAQYKDKKSCNLSLAASTSFFPAKPLGAYGDAGAFFTSDEGLAKAVRELKEHGQESRYHHTRIGINGRCDSIQAAIIEEKLNIFDEEIELRQNVANYYSQHLEGIIKTPKILDHNLSAWAQYTIEVDHREKFQAFMKDKGIPTSIHYPSTLNKQPAYSNEKFYHDSFPIAERAAKNVISLPMHPYLKSEEQDKVILAIKEFASK